MLSRNTNSIFTIFDYILLCLFLDLKWIQFQYIIYKLMQQSNPLLLTISNILDEIIKETDALEIEYNSNFHANKAPSITIYNYLQRIAKYSHCSE